MWENVEIFIGNIFFFNLYRVVWEGFSYFLRLYEYNFIRRFLCGYFIEVDCVKIVLILKKVVFKGLFYIFFRTCNVVCILNNLGLMKFNDK